MGEKVASLWVELGLDSASLEAGFSRAKNSLEKFTAKVKKYSSGAQDMIAGFYIVKSAINAVVQPIEAAAGAYIDLAAQVRAFSRATGVSSEEASKWIETMGDLKIPTESLTMAMRTMISNGMNPTIDTLATMADEYLALPPGVERAEYALKNFGARGGLEMAKALELGGDELRRLNDSVGENKILSDEAVKSAREFEIVQEELADAVEGVQIEIGTKLVKAVLWAVEEIENAGLAWRALTGQISSGEIAESWKKNNTLFAQSTKSFKEYLDVSKEWQANVVKAGEGYVYEEDIRIMNEAEYRLALLTAGVIDYSEATAGVPSIAGKIAVGTFALQEQKTAAENNKTAFNNMIIAWKGDDALTLAENLGKANDQMTALSIAMSGSLGGEESGYQKDIIGVRDRMIELKDLIAEEEAKPWWDKDKEKLKEYQDELDKIPGEYDALADAHEKATKRILFGFLQQQIQAGITAGTIDPQRGADILSEYALDAGLIDQTTAAAYKSMGGIAEKAADASISTSDIVDDLLGLPKDTTINVTEKRKVEYTNLGAPGSPNVAPGARPPINITMNVTENLNVFSVAKQVVKLIQQQAV
jgi:hypothetical protein